MTTDQVYIGIGLTLALAVACQLVGQWLRVPALIVLLPVGFAAGALTSDVNPNQLLGSAFQPLVSVSVAVILYDAGLGLGRRRPVGYTRRVVQRLLVLGVPLTLFAGAAVSAPLFGLASGPALMLGAILVVSGPTVVGPLLSFVRPTERLRDVLTWEGSLIDPIGGLLGAVVFHGVSASTHHGLGAQFLQFVTSLAVGVIGGTVGTAILWLVLVRIRPGEVLATAAQLATVVGVAAGCDVVRTDTGLIAGIAMGLAVSAVPAFDTPDRQPFFEVLVQLTIGLLFISIAATVTPASLHHLVLPTLALVAVLMLVVRPVVAYVSTLRTDLGKGERAFVGWMAPRGIVAAATASTFSAALVSDHVAGANKILPVTFMVIVVTVTLYGLTAAPVARRLGVVRPTVSRPLLVGGDPWVLDLARVLYGTGLSVLMWAEEPSARDDIRRAGFELAPDDLITAATGQRAELEGVTTILLMTDDDGFNALAGMLLRGGEGGPVYRLGSAADARGDTAGFASGDVLFGAHLAREPLVRRYRTGARLSVGAAERPVPPGHDVLFRVRTDGRLDPVTVSEVPSPEPGDRTIVLGPPAAIEAAGHD